MLRPHSPAAVRRSVNFTSCHSFAWMPPRTDIEHSAGSIREVADSVLARFRPK
ncbi:MAG: hypothetical protein HIU85_11440 [Proteobacteria bacterium]|nr:hypothetical protein [Pseudomonadota bacterium]